MVDKLKFKRKFMESFIIIIIKSFNYIKGFKLMIKVELELKMLVKLELNM